MRLAVLGSTNGTDLEAIVSAIRGGALNASVEVIISNNKNSGILKKAKNHSIDSCYVSHKNKKRGVFDLEITSGAGVVTRIIEGTYSVRRNITA